MAFAVDFLRILGIALWMAAPLFAIFAVVVILLGLIAGRIERWSAFDSLYWSFITAFTVGYGDIRPTTRRTKSLSLVIALCGLMLTGILVAVTVASASAAFERNVDLSVFESRS